MAELNDWLLLLGMVTVRLVSKDSLPDEGVLYPNEAVRSFNSSYAFCMLSLKLLPSLLLLLLLLFAVVSGGVVLVAMSKRTTLFVDVVLLGFLSGMGSGMIVISACCLSMSCMASTSGSLSGTSCLASSSATQQVLVLLFVLLMSTIHSPLRRRS